MNIIRCQYLNSYLVDIVFERNKMLVRRMILLTSVLIWIANFKWRFLVQNEQSFQTSPQQRRVRVCCGTGHQNINPANSFVKPFAGFSFMRSLSGQLLQNAVKMQSITPLLHPEITPPKALFPFLWARSACQCAYTLIMFCRFKAERFERQHFHVNQMSVRRLICFLPFFGQLFKEALIKSGMQIAQTDFS